MKRFIKGGMTHLHGFALLALTVLGGVAIAMGSPAPVYAEEDPFVLQYPELTLESGKETAAPITLKPKAGWKWNEDYPASAVVEVDGPCETTTQQLGKSGKKIELKGKDVVFPVGLKGNAAGAAKVKVTASFSICNEESCRIFRKRSLDFGVKIK